MKAATYQKAATSAKAPMFLISLALVLCAVITTRASGSKTARESMPDRQVALTIDDLPAAASPVMSGAETLEMTKQLLAKLKEANAPAVGFVNERSLYFKLGDADDRIRALNLWLDLGFELGNHTFAHTGLNRVSLAEWEDAVIQGEPILGRLLRQGIAFRRLGSIRTTRAAPRLTFAGRLSSRETGPRSAENVSSWVSGSLAGTGSSRRLRWIRRCANESAQWPAWRPGWILADRDDDRSGHFSADQRSRLFAAWGLAKALRDGIRSSQRFSGGAPRRRSNRSGRERRRLSAAESVHVRPGNAAGQYLCFLAGRLDSELSLHSMPGGNYVRHYSDGNRHHHRDVCFGSGLSQQRSFLDSLSISRHDAQSRDYLQIQHGSRRGHERGRNHGSLRPECDEQRIRGANRPISNVLSFHVSKRGAGAGLYIYLRHAKRPRAGLLGGLRHGQFASECSRCGDHAYCYGSCARCSDRCAPAC